MLSRVTRACLATSLFLALALAGTMATSATAGTAVPSEVPGRTPGINTGVGVGQVYALAKFDDTVVVGGNFTQANDFGSATAQGRTHLLAFDSATGALKSSFAPVLNGLVNSMVKGPVAGTVIVAGSSPR